MTAAGAGLAAALLLAAAPPDAALPPDAGSPTPLSLKQAYEEARATARSLAEAGETDRAMEAYELAWRRAFEAWQGRAFGTEKMTIPIGDISRRDFRTTTIEIPAGLDVSDEVAREAALAAGRLGRRDQAVGWARRVEQIVGRPPGSALTSGQSRIVEALRQDAVARQVPEDAVYYARLLQQDEADRQARWAAQAEAHRRFRWIAGGVALAVLAFAGFWLSKLARVVVAARREARPETELDFIAFSGVTVLKREPDGHPFRWRSSLFDLINRVALSAVLGSTIPLALFGAVAFARLGLDHAAPDRIGETALMLGLADLFAAFACFMALMGLAGPPSAVRREVELTAEGLVVRTVRGLFFTRRTEEAFPYAAIRSLRVLEHVEHVHHATVRLYLAVAGTPGRALVLGGTGKPERSRELLEALASATGLPIGG